MRHTRTPACNFIHIRDGPWFANLFRDEQKAILLSNLSPIAQKQDSTGDPPSFAGSNRPLSRVQSIENLWQPFADCKLMLLVFSAPLLVRFATSKLRQRLAIAFKCSIGASKTSNRSAPSTSWLFSTCQKAARKVVFPESGRPTNNACRFICRVNRGIEIYRIHAIIGLR